MLAVMFLEHQGCKVQENVLRQDNKSAMLLEKNGHISASEWTGVINMQCFQMKDCIEKKQLDIKHC